ncbi:ubiquitin-conjugating enzyme E2 U [Pelobates fuscus]|uniref:ubiquitin-conjugating enzyme E2 U n=1 Tax=Pelobates fuscus TaxID=191477 RepID=UPI002FE4CD57
MHSRAYLLLEREYQQLQEARLYGISATPRTDHLLEWVAEIRGLKDSLWEGCVLQLYMTYPENYNALPPKITFNTIPFHPNVDQSSGIPCISFLENPEEWNPRYTMSTILLTIQVMLSNPQAENAVNLEAADMWENRPSMYRQLTLDCVKNSRQIEASVIRDPPRVTATQELPLPPTHRKIKSVSFEDYHRNWTEIATSKVPENVKHAKYKVPSSETPGSQAFVTMNTNKLYTSFHIGSLYSNTSSPQISVRRGTPECLMCRLSDMLCMEPAAHLTISESEVDRDLDPKGEMSHRETGRNTEPPEDEVENLVVWANTLRVDFLEE